MNATHFEFLVEELSIEAFLVPVLPKILHPEVTFQIHVHQGKPDLLGKLENRLRGYARWLPDDYRVVVLLDRDEAACLDLKAAMEACATNASMLTRSNCAGQPWRVVNRIAIEELEAWFFGEWAAVREAFPKASAHIPHQASYREPDEIAGGTWEALERVLKRAGYFLEGLRKVEAAQQIGRAFQPARCGSQSFDVFRVALVEAMGRA